MPLVVLVVEDDAIVRMDTVSIIEEAGFEAIEAGNADEAIVLLEARADIKVVFTDIEMPGSMNGLKLAFRSARPLAEIQRISSPMMMRKSIS